MRHDSSVHSLLQSVLILLATAVLVVVVFRPLRLPGNVPQRVER